MLVSDLRIIKFISCSRKFCWGLGDLSAVAHEVIQILSLLGFGGFTLLRGGLHTSNNGKENTENLTLKLTPNLSLLQPRNENSAVPIIAHCICLTGKGAGNIR